MRKTRKNYQLRFTDEAPSDSGISGKIEIWDIFITKKFAEISFDLPYELHTYFKDAFNNYKFAERNHPQWWEEGIDKVFEKGNPKLEVKAHIEHIIKREHEMKNWPAHKKI